MIIINKPQILYPSFLDLNQILEDLIVRPQSSGVQGKLSCAQCGKTFDDMYKMRRHAETHLGMKLPCNLCAKVCGTTVGCV